MPQKTETDNGYTIHNRKTQWHMAFPPAMKLELMEYDGILQYYPEYLLNTKELQADTLIIKKRDVIIYPK